MATNAFGFGAKEMQDVAKRRYTTLQTTTHIRLVAYTLAVTAILGPVAGQEEQWERERNGYWRTLVDAIADSNPKAPRVVNVQQDGCEAGHALILYLADGSVSIIDELNGEESHVAGTTH